VHETQVPSSASELHVKGYNRFHCYSTAQIQLFEAYLALDAQHDIQSCATIWDGTHLSSAQTSQTAPADFTQHGPGSMHHVLLSSIGLSTIW
jgi:hypothetical protein